MKKEKRVYKGKRRCIIKDCRSENVFADKNREDFICLDCGCYWFIERTESSKLMDMVTENSNQTLINK